MVFCSKCGTEVQKEAIFCHRCGSRIARGDMASAALDAQHKQHELMMTSPETEPLPLECYRSAGSRRRWVAGAAAVAAVSVILASFLVLMAASQGLIHLNDTDTNGSDQKYSYRWQLHCQLLLGIPHTVRIRSGRST